MRNSLGGLLALGLVVVGSLGIGDGPTLAQSRVCYEVQDRDGWTNIRDRDSKQVVARIDNGQRVLAEGMMGDSVVLAAPHNQFVVHRSRIRVARNPSRCFRFTSIESDGYLNLRAAPQGKILGQILNGTAMLNLSEPKGAWVRVLTENGRTGFVHSPRLEVYN
jgi:Bacterial SH3 domain